MSCQLELSWQIVPPILNVLEVYSSVVSVENVSSQHPQIFMPGQERLFLLQVGLTSKRNTQYVHSFLSCCPEKHFPAHINPKLYYVCPRQSSEFYGFLLNTHYSATPKCQISQSLSFPYVYQSFSLVYQSFSPVYHSFSLVYYSFTTRFHSFTCVYNSFALVYLFSTYGIVLVCRLIRPTVLSSSSVGIHSP